jgi:PTS system cellobiose-specific IIA component
MDVLETAMGLITGAGDSQSYSMEAIMHAKTGDFLKAHACIEKAKEAMVSTHDVQTDLIRGEMMGEKSEVTLLMVHAQDHLTTAMLLRNMASEIVELYEKIASK